MHVSAARARRVELCGVRIDVRTDSADFDRYLAEHFPSSRDAESSGADLSVNVRWFEESAPPRAELFPGAPTDVQLDRHVLTGAGRILWLRVDDAPPIALAAERDGRNRRFDVCYHFSLGRPGWQTSLRRTLGRRRLPALRHKRLSTLTYYALYYPAWWHLEAAGAAHPLHAGAIVVNGQALVLGGLPGAGKSTLVASFLAVPGAELLSDNVVLYGGGRILGCFEPLLLDRSARAALDGMPLRALGRRHIWERDAFHAPHRTGAVPAGAVVVLARGPRTVLERLAPGDCARTLLAINEAAKEVRRYHVFASVLGLVEPEALVHVGERFSHLERLLTGVPCYRLQVREGAPGEAVGLLTELITPARETAP
jgi:hypothetical protein